jgi:hypothetical protein
MARKCEDRLEFTIIYGGSQKITRDYGSKKTERKYAGI